MSSRIRLTFKGNQDMSKVADFIHGFICSINSVHILGETRSFIDVRPDLSYAIDSDGTIEVIYETREDYSMDVMTCDSNECV